jgi:ElaB/YqjD/DUF883 family membrane-anchored ribosome-binding protein
MARYQTPNALRSDAQTLAQDARNLVDATAQIADEKVTAARARVSDALERGKDLYASMQGTVAEKARAADRCVRENPYQSIAIAVGVGILVGILMNRRD